MNWRDSDHVLPLRDAEHGFLEVLLSEFSLHRRARGTRMEVAFDDASPAIWSRAGTEMLRRTMPAFAEKWRRYQEELDAFLVRGDGDRYDFSDPDFVFRYASGGTLPILRTSGKDYYCLFYREVHPIGWNIANGGCDSREELSDPLATIDRELREELLVVDPTRRVRYAFEADAGRPTDHPDFVRARRLWMAVSPRLDIGRFQELSIPLLWHGGPDMLDVRHGPTVRAQVTGCFLNVNAEDFGIEVDRVARMKLDGDLVLLDGSILRGRLVNSPVALFETDRLDEALRGGATTFLPDRFFYNGQAYDDGGDLEWVVRDLFLPEVKGLLADDELAAWESGERKFDLCPVTRRLLTRFRAICPAVHEPLRAPVEVFVSFASEDRELGQKVAAFLRERKRSVFFSDDSIRESNFGRAISDALESARHMVVVASDPAHVRKEWVAFEYQVFNNDLLCRRKPPNANLVTFASGIESDALPPFLRGREVITFPSGHPEDGLEELGRFIR